MKHGFSFIGLLLTGLLIGVLALSVFLIQKQTIFKPKATDNLNRPPIIVQYHIWWDTPYGPESKAWPQAGRTDSNFNYRWAGWDVRDYGGRSQAMPSPDKIKADGWRRVANTTSDFYPMIGLYDTDDPEVLRWHIKLAKASGIKAFAVSTYLWSGPKGERLVEIMRKFLDVAKEENFLLTWEIWWGEPDMEEKLYKYRDIFSHPAFYRVDGKPMFWIAPGSAPYNFFGNNIDEFNRITDNIEKRLGFPLYWAINNGNPNIDFAKVNKPIIKMTGTSLFGANPQWWKEEIDAYHKLGQKAGTHLYPGFNDLLGPQVRYDARDGGQKLISILKKSGEFNPDFIFIESWNDFGESTAIEPGIKEDFFQEPYKMDYYKDLRIIADFNGIPFVPPPMIAQKSMDPAVVERMNVGILEFKATVGIGKGASCSNGVRFNLLTWFNNNWVEVVGKDVSKDDGLINMSANISPLWGKNTTFILGADDRGNSACDWAHWTSAGIYRNGTKIYDFVTNAPKANWHSSKGTIKWGTGGEKGTATYGYGVEFNGGVKVPKTLYVHPDYYDNGFTHGGYDSVDLTVKPPPTP